MFKKILALSIILILSIGTLSGCSKTSKNSSDKKENVVLKVGATPEPHAKFLELIKGDLKKEGIDLKIVEFTDYVQPNMALSDGDIDANFFQHEPYLENFVKERKLDLVSIGKIHLEPMGIYSDKIKSLDELKNGDSISIPDDPTNGARALLLLEKNKLITLKKDAGFNATVRDIEKNPKKLKIETLDAAQLPRTLNDFTASVINGNFALQADLNPTKDAIAIEPKDSPYSNIVAVRKEDKDNKDLKKLVKALQSEKIKDYIEKNFKGGVIPSF